MTAAYDKASPGEPISFISFISSLGANTLVSLGLGSLPGQAPQAPDLRLAREFIEVLELLHDKTRGNLDAEEAAALQALLTDLRLRYVAVAEQAERGRP